MSAIAAALAELRAQRTAIDGIIQGIEQLQRVGLAPIDVAVDAPTPAPAQRRLPAATTKKGGAPAGGAWDAKILAHVALAPPLGTTVKDIVLGVAGKSRYDEAYGAVWNACKSLAARGRIRRDGRFYMPVEAAAS